MCSEITIGKQNFQQNLDKKLHFGIYFDSGYIQLFNLTFLLLDLPGGPSTPRYREYRSCVIDVCDEFLN